MQDARATSEARAATGTTAGTAVGLGLAVTVATAAVVAELGGTVQAGGAVPLVVHSAQVSPGNSGGPLVDLCGRVVGINTFVQGDQTAAHVNYALSGGDLLGFLKANGVAPQSSAGACNPTAVTASTAEPD